MTILLTGKNGQLGYELYHKLQSKYKVIALGRDNVDFCNSHALKEIIQHLPYLSLIVNIAAYTHVDQAEDEPTIVERVNVEAPAILAAEAARRDIPIIHFSTSYVFDGQIDKPYIETDLTYPLSIYGRSKLASEKRILELSEKHLLFRLSSLYDMRCRNFFTAMLRNLYLGETPTVVSDQIIAPNWTPMITDAVEHAIRIVLSGKNPNWGIYHLSSSGSTSCYEFSNTIFRIISERYSIRMPEIIPVTSEEFAAKAIRPSYSLLDTTKFQRDFNYQFTDWLDQLQHCINHWPSIPKTSKKE